jgi:hypothetical protein
MALVTLAAAHKHIRADWTLAASPVDPRDADLQAKVDQASDIILSYLKIATSPPYYDDTTAPKRVQAATLLLVANLWEFRGDDLNSPDEKTWEAIARLLIRDRDPALA